MKLAALVVLALAGCLEPFAPDVGAPNAAPCSPNDTDPDHDVSFAADILDGIFKSDEYKCYECHTAAGDTPIGLELGGLDLSGYAGLRRGGAQGGGATVKPGDACGSVLVQKVSASPPFGARMPLFGPPYLDDEDVDLIHDWIAEGALDD